ncbi:MAG: hypothetical protein AB7S26_31435 [Sandaracinaceae bacterium]
MSYRVIRAALRGERERLRAGRDAGGPGRAGALRELLRVEAELREHRRRALTVLDAIHIAAPCGEDWNAMTGSERVRRCDRCDNEVYDLSTMTSLEVVEHLAGRGATGCVRLFRRADGTVMTKDCAPGKARRRRRRAGVAAAMAVGVSGALAVLPAMGAAGEPGEREVTDPAVEETRVEDTGFEFDADRFLTRENDSVLDDDGVERGGAVMHMGAVVAPTSSGHFPSVFSSSERNRELAVEEMRRALEELRLADEDE